MKLNNMKQNTLQVLALSVAALSLTGTVNASEKAAPTQPDKMQQEAFEFCQWLPERFNCFDAKRDKAENPYIQKFALTFRAQHQTSLIAPAGGEDRLLGAEGRGQKWNDEWRRFRLGAKAKLFNMFDVAMVWNIGGLNGSRAYNSDTESWSRKHTSGSLDSFSLKGKSGDLAYEIGKFKVAYTGEYRTSSSKIKTIERSSIVNQLTAGKNYGIRFKNSDKKAQYGWNTGVWLNGARESSIWGEPVLSTDANVLLGASFNMSTGQKSRLTLDYTHSFVNLDKDGKIDGLKDGVSYEGSGSVDMLALTWVKKGDKFNFMGELIAGFKVINADAGAENIYGLILLPSYRFSPHFEGVFRYQLAAGSNAVKNNSRYYGTNSNYSKYSDLLHTAYLGLNYYVCPAKPDMMKIMLGVEYENSHGTDSKGKKGYTGWSITTALRANF